jgi:hypothetical protein
MSTREETASPSALVRLLTHLRKQLGEVARECSHAMLCCPHSNDQTERK